VIGTQVAVLDIRDAEGFVANALNKSGVRLSLEEKTEMLAEGITILLELAVRYKPRLDGYTQDGTFSGYAGRFLPGRLQDAYYRLHPEHQLKRGADGRKVREFGQPALSLYHEDMPEPVASMYLGPMAEDGLPDCPTAAIASLPWQPTEVTAKAIRRIPAEYRIGAKGVVKYTEAGLGVDEIASALGLGRRDVSEIRSAFGSALHYELRTEAA
jgi:hypothetical protein